MFTTATYAKRFIALEGIDGIGKTGQAYYLFQSLCNLYPGHQVRMVREPGSTAAGEDIRRVLLESGHSLHPMTELFLHAAARRQLVSEGLLDWIRAGDLIIADRYTGSTFAYQGAALRSHPDFRDVTDRLLQTILEDIVGLATDGGQANPGLNILYIPADEDAMDAIIARKSLDQQAADFLWKVDERYVEIADEAPEAWQIIEVTADQGPASIAAATLDIVTEHLTKAGLPPQREQASE